MLTRKTFAWCKFFSEKTLYATVAVTLGISLWCRKGEEFRVRSFALHRHQPEKDKQTVDFASPWKNFCGSP